MCFCKQVRNLAAASSETGRGGGGGGRSPSSAIGLNSAFSSGLGGSSGLGSSMGGAGGGGGGSTGGVGSGGGGGGSGSGGVVSMVIGSPGGAAPPGPADCAAGVMSCHITRPATARPAKLLRISDRSVIHVKAPLPGRPGPPELTSELAWLRSGCWKRLQISSLP